jgi:hypothetical protein
MIKKKKKKNIEKLIKFNISSNIMICGNDINFIR